MSYRYPGYIIVPQNLDLKLKRYEIDSLLYQGGIFPKRVSSSCLNVDQQFEIRSVSKEK